MRNLLMAAGVTGLVLTVSVTVGWNVVLAVVVLAAVTGLAVGGLLRGGHPAPAPAQAAGRVGARQAWRDWNTARVRSGRAPVGRVIRRLPELLAATAGGLAATAGGLVEAVGHPRRSGGPGPFRRRYDRVLGRRPAAATAGAPRAGPTVVTGPAGGVPDLAAANRPAGGGRSEPPPTARPSDPNTSDSSDDGAVPAQKEEPQMITTTGTITGGPAGALGTAGRASVSGLVVDWETSVQAREHPETFVAWLQAQAAGARYASTLVPDLVKQFHGRGPSGHAGVPDQIIDTFARNFEDARTAEADAYARFAAEYAAYVEQAEAELTHTYGREVLASAHEAHQNRA